MLKKAALWAFCSLVILVTFSARAGASLSISPARVGVTLEYGETFTYSYNVTNNYSYEVEVIVTSRNWNNARIHENVQVTDWLEVSKSSLILQPEESADVYFTVRVPENVRGGLTAMISFTIRAANINIMTSVPVSLIICGTQEINFEIAGLNLMQVPPTESTQGSFNAGFNIENKSNMLIRPVGEVLVRSLRRRDRNNEPMRRIIYDVPPVFSDSRRFVGAQFNHLPNGRYRLEMTIESDGYAVTKRQDFRIRSGEVQIAS